MCEVKFRSLLTASHSFRSSPSGKTTARRRLPEPRLEQQSAQHSQHSGLRRLAALAAGVDRKCVCVLRTLPRHTCCAVNPLLFNGRR